MKSNWRHIDEERADPPNLISFSVAVLPQRMIIVQLRCALTAAEGDQSFLTGLSAEVARELAAGLLQAAELMGDTPGAGRLH